MTGWCVGPVDGLADGLPLGSDVGLSDGRAVGAGVGVRDGFCDAYAPPAHVARVVGSALTSVCACARHGTARHGTARHGSTNAMQGNTH